MNRTAAVSINSHRSSDGSLRSWNRAACSVDQRNGRSVATLRPGLDQRFPSSRLSERVYVCLRVRCRAIVSWLKNLWLPAPLHPCRLPTRNTRQFRSLRSAVGPSGAQQRFPAAAAGILVQQFTVHTTIRQPIRTAEGVARRFAKCTNRCTDRCARGWPFPGFSSSQANAGC